MTILGTLLRNRHAGDTGLAWNQPNLASGAALELTSPNFESGTGIPLLHASKHVGGGDVSPELQWDTVPESTAALLLVLQDPDVPIPWPALHCVAVLEPTVTGLGAGAVSAGADTPGVLALRAFGIRGYHGPAPIKGHGPHRYVFQLFALGRPVPAGKARAVIAGAGPVLARGRLDGTFER